MDEINSFAAQPDVQTPSYTDRRAVEDAYNNCISNPDPQLKLEACRRYEELLNKYDAEVPQAVGVLSDIAVTKGYADGGPVFAEEDEYMMEDDMEEEGEGMEAGLIDRAKSVLAEQDFEILLTAVDMHPDLPRIFDQILMSVEEFEDAGKVEGPGTETSDSIPAKLSDGEFVFTAKAVKHLGADVLMALMKLAEERADSDEEFDEEEEISFVR